MDINFTKVLYLFFRLSPFIIVTYFTLMSIFNQDIRGLIYLSGLIFTCIIILGVAKISGMEPPVHGNISCRISSLGLDSPFSPLPLGIATLFYTFSYIMAIVIDNKIVNKNIQTIIVFIVLILVEAGFQITNKCSDPIKIALAGIVSILCGLLWWAIISSTGTNLLLFVGIDQKEICDRPIRSKYRCRITSN